MSKSIKVGDILELSYLERFYWNPSWKGVRLEIISVKTNTFNDRYFEAKIIYKPSSSIIPFDEGHIETLYTTNPSAYILVKSRGSKSHLPVWF